jgi:RNA polymerase sigma-70 factor (ECF subfamily)
VVQPAAGVDDAALLRAWRDGDADAGSELFRRHFRSVLRFVRTKVDGELDDLIQRIFLGCVEAIDRFREDAKFKTFLLSIARNQVLLHYRDRARGHARRVSDLSVRELGGGSSPSGVMARREEERLLLQALRRLPLDQQMTLELYYWEDLSVADIAEVLDVAAGTVKSRLGRAREALRDCIANLHASDDARERTLTNLDAWAGALRDAIKS